MSCALHSFNPFADHKATRDIVATAWNNRDTIRALLDTSVPEMKARSARNFELLAGLLAPAAIGR